jgi:hypothetical protein
MRKVLGIVVEVRSMIQKAKMTAMFPARRPGTPGSIRPLLLAAIAGAGIAAASAAQSAPLSAMTGADGLRQAVFRADAGAPVTSPGPALSLPYDKAAPIVSPGVAQTAVDHHFSSGGLVGSAGFLCGLRPSVDNNGASTTTGYDPEGRFVGAKLSYAFR